MYKSRRQISLRKKAVFSLVILTLFLLIAEGVARMVVPDVDAKTYQEHAAIIRVLGLPALNDAMEPDTELLWRLKPQIRQLRVNGQIRDSQIDFTVNTHDGLRFPKVSALDERLRILALGDSCTFGLGVQDDQTWPAQLQLLLDKDGPPADVINSGVPGYTAWQGKRFLESRGLALRPDIVVACFGFNDIEKWSSRSDMEIAALVSSNRFETTLMHSRFYFGLKKWWNADVDAEGKTMSIRRPRLTEEQFFATLLDIKRVCDDNKIQFVLMMWPYAGQVEQRMNQPLKYQVATAAVSHIHEVPCVNLVHEFIQAGGPLFVDHVHANDDGCRVAAAAVYRVIRPFLLESDDP